MDYDYTEIFEACYKEGNAESLEQAIKNMKIFGASRTECIKVVKHQLDISLGEAETLVNSACVW